MPTPAELQDSLKALTQGIDELKQETESLKLKNLALDLENKELQRDNKERQVTLQNGASTDNAHDARPPDAPLEPPNTLDGKDNSRSDSKADAATGSVDPAQAKSSPPAEQENPQPTPDLQYWKPNPHDAPYCTQRCLLGLKHHGTLDGNCPNVDLHRRGRASDQHPIGAESLVQLLKHQLDNDVGHNITIAGISGSSGMPFKVTSAVYGYTVVGKVATDSSWGEVSREAAAYKILQEVQGSAVPVFLGSITRATGCYSSLFAKSYRHMLLMAWGGDMFMNIVQSSTHRSESERSKGEILRLGVIHQSLHDRNILWNEELHRALIIDFHRFKLDPQRIVERLFPPKRKASGDNGQDSKRHCAG
ncbi:hypothetical protein PHISP_05164 [Aspergillus sp. HF37]|nr:hypothetical protein PHISP_05164 [Aspergillus sp. HF37]